MASLYSSNGLKMGKLYPQYVQTDIGRCPDTGIRTTYGDRQKACSSTEDWGRIYLARPTPVQKERID